MSLVSFFNLEALLLHNTALIKFYAQIIFMIVFLENSLQNSGKKLICKQFSLKLGNWEETFPEVDKD